MEDKLSGVTDVTVDRGGGDGGKGLTEAAVAEAWGAAYSHWPTEKQEDHGGGGGIGVRGAAAAMKGQQWNETLGRHEGRKPHRDSARQDSPSGWG